MTPVAPYDPAEPLPAGRSIIQASAGTGKTFTIAAAVTRLVAEEGLSVDEILVVTFTRAATAELKGRIRKRMVEARRLLESGPGNAPPDEHMGVLLAVSEEDRARYLFRLEDAITHFDRAQIFTIDGFARRLLTQLGFRSRLAVELEPGEMDDLVLRRAAADLVVGRFAAGGDGIGEDPTRTVAQIGGAVVGTPDAEIVPDVSAVEGVPKIRAELAMNLRDVMARRLRSHGRVTFDGTLIEARAALTDPEIASDARALLRKRYSVALVDESQDTDPIQWQVIRGVFDDCRLVVIGDPKQSIYGFRGADVEAYLAAVEGAGARRTLDTNWRSDGPLLGALDSLFRGVTFGDERIPYHAVVPAPHHEAARLSGSGAPLVIRRFSPSLPIGRYRNGKHFLVDAAQEAVAADAAAEVVRLLASGATLHGDAGPRRVEPGDVAVLCRTRSQVDRMRKQLSMRDVPSVAARTGGVFASTAAEEWRRFLIAVERPERASSVRMAATTVFVGNSPADVADLDDERALELQRRFRRWHGLLNDHGIPSLITEVDRRSDFAARVLSGSDGERTMTDLMHIAEELHTVWRKRRIGSLVAWLESAMDEAARNAERNVDDPESRQRRLETDAAAVQVQTIHAAKGLEYPIVLVPYLWDIPKPGAAVPVFHGPPAGAGQPRPRFVDVGGPDSPDFEQHRAAALAEDAAEEARLLYVALTRARHHLVVWWIDEVKKCADTVLHRLLTRRGANLTWLVDDAGGTIETVSVSEVPPVDRYRSTTPTPAQLERARFDRGLDATWRRVSFSSLSPEDPLTTSSDTADDADRVDETAADEAAPASATGVLPMGDLPRGARFGTLVHGIFEAVPFDRPDPAATIRAELERATRHASWEFDVEAFCIGLAAALDTPLGPNHDAPTLRHLDPARMLREMTFELPVRTGSGTTSLREVAAVMLDHLPLDDRHRPFAEGLRRLDPRRFRGFLTGAIDLTAAVPGKGGDRYVVIDYKSNALPMRGEAPSTLDYGPRALDRAMHDGNYVLQALLYQVALHRYLQWRLVGYDPARHLGGSMYLFVRGMVGADTPVVDGERCGVARWSPPPEMVAALSDLFTGSTP